MALHDPAWITQRDLQRAERFLYERPPDKTTQRLMGILRQASLLPDGSALKARLHDEVIRGTETYRTQLRVNPYATAPAALIGEGEFTLAYQVADNAPIRISRAELARHLLVISSSGSGKTTFLHNLIPALLGAGLLVCILDQKDDARYLATRYPGFAVLHADAPLNLLQVPPYLTQAEAVNLNATSFASALYSADRQRSVLIDALQRGYRQHGTPSLEQLKAVVDQMYNKHDTYTRRDAVEGVSRRLERLATYPGFYNTTNGILFTELFSRPFLLSVRHLTEIEEYIFTLLLHHLYQYARHLGDRRLRWVVILDEGFALFSDDNSRIAGPTLGRLQSLVREWGIALVTSSVSTHLHPLVRANAYTVAAMNLTDGKEAADLARTFGLDALQAEFFTNRLTLGQCVLRLGDRWREPILARFDPLPLNLKQVDWQAWEAAKQRTNALAPARTPPLDVAQPQPPIATPSSTPAVQTRPVALTPAELALLRVVADRIMPLTQAFRAAGIKHPQAGQRARKKLTTLGLGTTTRVVFKAGRGGSGQALEVTDAGYARLGITPPRRTPGGAQHRYLVAELSRALRNAPREVQLGQRGAGGKSVDLLLTIGAAHRPFLEALAKTGIALGEGYQNPEPGALVAVEVEVSNPARTAKNNIEQNAAAGVALSVIAVLPKMLKATVRALQAELRPGLWSRAVVVDALTLLNALWTSNS